MRVVLCAVLLYALPAYAQVPNHAQVVHELAAGRDLSTIEAQDTFTDDVVCALNRVDRRWGHLRKSGSQTQLHGHATDAALYKVDAPGLSVAVDFIGDGGASNARPVWIVDAPRYTTNDWLDPHNCGTAPEQPPAPVVDLSAVLAKLDALSNQIAAVALQVAAVSDRAGNAWSAAQSARERIEDTIQAVDLARQQINRPPLYTGKVFGVMVTLRPTVHPANPIP